MVLMEASSERRTQQYSRPGNQPVPSSDARDVGHKIKVRRRSEIERWAGALPVRTGLLGEMPPVQTNNRVAMK